MLHRVKQKASVKRLLAWIRLLSWMVRSWQQPTLLLAHLRLTCCYTRTWELWQGAWYKASGWTSARRMLRWRHLGLSPQTNKDFLQEWDPEDHQVLKFDLFCTSDSIHPFLCRNIHFHLRLPLACRLFLSQLNFLSCFFPFLPFRHCFWQFIDFIFTILLICPFVVSLLSPFTSVVWYANSLTHMHSQVKKGTLRINIT